MTHQVYVVGAVDGPFKIGYTANLRDRLTSIQTGSHTKLTAVHTVSVSRKDARRIEGHAHHILHSSRLSGEWFKVTFTQAIKAVDQAVDYVTDTAARKLVADQAKEAAAKTRDAEVQRRQAHDTLVKLLHAFGPWTQHNPIPSEVLKLINAYAREAQRSLTAPPSRKAIAGGGGGEGHSGE